MVGDVDGTGASGELVKVKRGFARNYLIPKKLAAYVTDSNREKYSHLINAEEHATQSDALSAAHAEKRISDLHAALQSAGALELVLVAKAAENGSLYGSIGAADIAAHLHAMGVAGVTVADIVMDTVKSAGDEVHALHVAGMPLSLQVQAE